MNKLFTRRIHVVSAMLLAVLIAFHDTSVSAIVQGDGMAIYGEGTVATPRYRDWTQLTTSWGAEMTGASAATARHVVNKTSPTRDEALVGVQATNGTVYIQRWDGESWSTEWTVAVTNGNLPRFDIAYESISGEAVVVYSRNAATTNELQYRRWDGSTWTAATNLDAIRTSGVVHAVQLQAANDSDDIALAWGDAALDLSANYWLGATNSWVGEPAAALSTSLAVVGTGTVLTNWSFDVAVESISGDVLVVWGNNTVLDLQYATRSVGSGGVWGAATTHAAALEEPTDLELASDPDSDYIAYANASDNGADADAATWSGTAWNAFNNFDTAIDTVAVGTNNIAVGWVSSGGQSRAIVTYDDTNNGGVDWVVYNKNTNTWALQTDFTAAPAPSAVDDKLHRIRSNPYDKQELTLLVIDSASDLFAKRLVFDGTNLTWTSSEPGAVALELTVSSITGAAADFAYWRFIPPPGTLSTDIVDGTGVSVPFPSLNMLAIAASNSCQVTSGTLGISSQKIRVANATITPGWTLSMAPTEGATTAWSGTTANYDFNDPIGTPAGCQDGADADNLPGQLSVNPSMGLITPQAGCSAAGITLSSASAYSQGLIDSMTLMNASSGAQMNCYWDLTGVGLSQRIPSFQAPGAYAIEMTVTVVAN